jgi:hypothetical protein
VRERERERERKGVTDHFSAANSLAALALRDLSGLGLLNLLSLLLSTLLGTVVGLAVLLSLLLLVQQLLLASLDLAKGILSASRSLFRLLVLLGLELLEGKTNEASDLAGRSLLLLLLLALDLDLLVRSSPGSRPGDFLGLDLSEGEGLALLRDENEDLAVLGDELLASTRVDAVLAEIADISSDDHFTRR